jgi:hypothetical protein
MVISEIETKIKSIRAASSHDRVPLLILAIFVNLKLAHRSIPNHRYSLF